MIFIDEASVFTNEQLEWLRQEIQKSIGPNYIVSKIVEVKK